jgi:hypothetical protein
MFKRKPDPVASLVDAIERLQIAIASNLITDYGTRLRLQTPGEAVLLADCVLSYATAMNPVGESAQQYGKTHANLVETEALRIATLAEVAEAFSYLYAAITLLLAIRSGNPFSDTSVELGTRATELSLYIPNTYDICGSDDAVCCIQAIAMFATNYQRALSR